MNRMLAVLLLFTSLPLAGCEPASVPRSTTPVGDRIIAGVVPAPPISQVDATSLTPKGHAIDLIKAIGDRSGTRIEFVATDWANMSAALSSGRVQVVVGPIFQTEARAKEFGFTSPIWSYAIVAVKRASNTEISSRQDLITKRWRVAVGRGGFDAEFAARIMKNSEIRVLPPEQPDGAMLEILSDRADVAFVDRATAKRFLTAHPELDLVANGAPMSLQLAGFMLARDNKQLREFLDVALRNLAVTGELAATAQPYLSQDAFEGLPLAEQYDVGSRTK